MPPRVVVMVAAWLEIVVGALFITALDTMCRLLFAAGPEGAAMPLGRLVRVALFSLGVASLPSSSLESSRSVVMGLFAYNPVPLLYSRGRPSPQHSAVSCCGPVSSCISSLRERWCHSLARKPVRTPQIEPTHQL